MAGCKDTSVHLRILSHLFALQSGNADACFWVLLDIYCAIGALCHEHNVVYEDLERREENTGEVVMIDPGMQILEPPTRVGIPAIIRMILMCKVMDIYQVN